jgi:hypothetical protein
MPLIPLATRPKPGGSVIDVVGPVPSEQQIADAEQDAAKATCSSSSGSASELRWRRRTCVDARFRRVSAFG